MEHNENCRNIIQSRIVENQTGVDAFRENLVGINNQIEDTIQLLSDRKLEKLQHYEMDRRQIESNLFMNKQDKLSRLISSQNGRVKILDRLGN